VEQGAPATFTLFRMARIPRLIRIASVLRLLRFFQELRTMVDSILNTLKSLASTIVLLLLLIYIVSVYLTSLVAQEAHARPWILEGEKGLGTYYGSVLMSMLSVFQATTSGLDWNDVLKPLMDDISPLMAIPVALYIAFTVLAMMNVITGVFVESALSAARSSKDAELRNKMHMLFKRTDTDASGMISWDEFAGHLEDKDMARCFRLLDIDPSEAKGLFTLLDTDCSGEIDAEEFVMGCLRLQGTAKAIDLATLMYFNKRISTGWLVHVGSIRSSLNEINGRIIELDMCINVEDNKGSIASVRSSVFSTQHDDISEFSGVQPLQQQLPQQQQQQGTGRRVRASMGVNSEKSAAQQSRESVSSEQNLQSLASFATWAGLKADHASDPSKRPERKRSTNIGLRKSTSSASLKDTKDGGTSKPEAGGIESADEESEDGGPALARSASSRSIERLAANPTRRESRATTQPSSALHTVLPNTPSTS